MFRWISALVLLIHAPVMGASLKPMIENDQISEKIRKTALVIDRDYADRDLTILMVLKGSLFLVADLMRAIHVPCELEFVQCNSYGRNGTQRGALTVTGLDALELKDRDVLIVDDIFDSGNTMATLTKAVLAKQPRSVKSLVLLYKKNVPRVTDLHPDYVLFEIENEFVIGYGLDYKEQYRGLSGVYIFHE